MDDLTRSCSDFGGLNNTEIELAIEGFVVLRHIVFVEFRLWINANSSFYKFKFVFSYHGIMEVAVSIDLPEESHLACTGVLKRPTHLPVRRHTPKPLAIPSRNDLSPISDGVWLPYSSQFAVKLFSFPNINLSTEEPLFVVILEMVTLFCAIVGVAESLFPVDIEPGETVGDLKAAIKEINKNDPVLKNVDAKDLQLFLAKKSGAWLSGEDPALLGLEKGRVHPDILEMMDAKPMGADKTLQFLLFEKNKMPQPSTDQIHVLVVIPAGATSRMDQLVTNPGAILYSNLPPKPLVSSEGATWDFQNPLDNEQLSNAIRKHYNAWKRGYYDKILHSLFSCWSGPGTGKSRLLHEFPKLLKDWLFAGKSENPDMIRLLQNAFTFNITFDKETPHEAGSFSSAAELIGTRMLYQLQDTLKWAPFVQEKSHHSVPSDVMDKLSKILGTSQKDMCVILCVDGMEKLSHENESKGCDFHKVLSVLSSLVDASECWVIAICSASIYSPVKTFLLSSPQWAYEVPTAILSRPTVEGEDIFAPFDGDKAIELLIDDMGGHGRALVVSPGILKRSRETSKAGANPHKSRGRMYLASP